MSTSDISNTAKRNRVLEIIGWNLSIFQTIVSVVAVAFLKITDLLPDKYVIAFGIIALLLMLIARLLMKRRIKLWRWIIGVVICVLVSAAMIASSVMLYNLSITLQNVTGVTEQTAQVAVYVRIDDDAETITDTAYYSYGMMDTLLHDDAADAIDLIEEELEVSLDVTEYDGIVTLADALLDGDCDAMLFSEDYVEMMTEIDGYEDFDEQVRELTTYTWTEVIEVEEEEEEEEEAEEDDGDNTFILYMSGIDTTGSVSVKSRSDVNILAVVNVDTRQVLLLSTPRDYYVELSLSGSMDKLTHAGLYGVEVSMETLEILYDTDIQYYFRINFTGFEDLIDALGGITVYSEYAFTATKGGYYYSVGYNDMNGAQALSFARERKAFSDGDIQRGKNQMAVIEAVIDKMMTTAMLQNFSNILASVEDCFETNMSYTTLSSLVKMQLSEGGDWNIQTYSVSGTGSSQYTYSGGKAYVMIPDEETVETAKEYINAVLNGEILEVSDDDDE